MLNDRYEPTSEDDFEDSILDALRENGRMRPKHIGEEISTHRGNVNHYLKRLVAAGWLENPHPGLYEFAYDPREMTDTEIALVLLEYAVDKLENDGNDGHAEIVDTVLREFEGR